MRNEYHNLILSGLIYAQKLLIFTDLTETIIKIEVLIVFSKVRALIFLSWNNLLENLLKKKKLIIHVTWPINILLKILLEFGKDSSQKIQRQKIYLALLFCQFIDKYMYENRKKIFLWTTTSWDIAI